MFLISLRNKTKQPIDRLHCNIKYMKKNSNASIIMRRMLRLIEHHHQIEDSMAQEGLVEVAELLKKSRRCSFLGPFSDTFKHIKCYQCH